jgi:DMSO/TMAO reductase YedYZ molybdopterin-dependent catalytic subunit
MRYPWVNTLLLALIPLGLATGYLGLTNGHPGRAWILWLHAIAGYSVVALAVWKVAVIRRSLERKPLGSPSRPAFLILGFLTGFVLVSGIAWAWAGPGDIGGASLMTLHATAATGVGLIFAWHVFESRVVFRVKRSHDRRAFLRLAIAGTAGFAIWQGGLLTMRLFRLPGAARRFTGSYERGSGTGNFPAVSWIADDPDPVGETEWRLRIDGLVAREIAFSYIELKALAPSTVVETIDCTGGWYSEQQWTGIPLGDLLALAGPTPNAGSVTVTGVTGYNRRFSLAEAATALLAFEVAGSTIGDGHGFPARLVMPDHRGFDWVKWVTRITVNEHGDAWQAPLPLQ